MYKSAVLHIKLLLRIGLHEGLICRSKAIFTLVPLPVTSYNVAVRQRFLLSVIRCSGLTGRVVVKNRFELTWQTTYRKNLCC